MNILLSTPGIIFNVFRDLLSLHSYASITGRSLYSYTYTTDCISVHYLYIHDAVTLPCKLVHKHFKPNVMETFVAIACMTEYITPYKYILPIHSLA